MDPERPQIFVLSGPNGAGKTTAAGVVLPERLGIEQFVNADLIARGLSPFAPERMAFRAGRLMLERIHDLRARGESFGFETTLASRSYASFLRDAQASGYVVELVYIWLSSVDLALSRVRGRVAQGGRGPRRRSWNLSDGRDYGELWMTNDRDAEADVLDKRLDEIADGLREAIRREVARLRRLGLPVYVAENGHVVERPESRAC